MVGVYSFSPVKKRSIFSLLSMTLILVGLNIVAFVIFTILLGFKVPVDYVAIKPANILNGKYLWTFVTSMFMHGGFFHLFANMFSLVFIGSLVEKIIGPKRYLSFYLISGLLAGLFFVVVGSIMYALGYPGDFNTFAVGASGALFGLVGLLVLLTPNLPVFVMFIPIPIKMKYAGPGILIVLWLISVAGNVPIGNTAHLGGLLAGLGYGLYLRRKYKNKVRMIGRHFS
ncbi:MAG: rhomboid family intramembrane serine protease [Nanoarchaeota archaeon]|nr:rhomboid family intramembrane serine protease [Nanoarchaeota archaeon]MBU1501253.1 rhomboid family intramembrane serine protease [Nanoarchaeota archaeon]MBU2459471.1 rhomboid family intramembrane serine protease [Nanoarchaeota archaeon]